MRVKRTSRMQFTLSRFGDRGWFLPRRLLIWLLLGIALVQLAGLRPTAAAAVSNYELAQAAPFNQVETYPISSLPSRPEYRPMGEWLGRLVLPSETSYAEEPGDWVWFEVWHAPAAAERLRGQLVKLTWRDAPLVQTYLDQVTTDIDFTPKAEKFRAQGNIVPFRLDGRKAVGPLQSLAGARPKDDVTVKLVGNPAVVATGEIATVEIGLEPVQVTGREYGLVKILAPDPTVTAALPTVCPGAPPCPSDYFQVQHFDAATREFSGAIETVRIPQQPAMKGDRFLSTIRDLASAPAGQAGWYMAGSRDAAGVFTVQALQPRQLLQVQPDQVIVGKRAGQHYLDRENWADTPARKGTVQRVLVSATAPTPEAAIADWQVGDYGLVMHLFGGIGGENKELTPLGTVSGHFSYGLAEVVIEPIAQEPQFQIHYQQVYAHNSGGIVSGTLDWTAYAGDLQRGWVGTRPFSDIVVKLDYFISDLNLGDTTLSLFRQLLIQTQIIAARYRTGDGSGVSTVTPATSCVQDSNQALFIAIQQIKQQAETDPNLTAYIAANPNEAAVQQVDQFAELGQDLARALTPYGVIRPDWQTNAETLAGVDARGNELASRSGLIAGILSWRTMMPRWGQDDIANVFLRNGADLWFLRTNQIGGTDPTIAPLPATALFGLIPGVSRVALRLARSVAVPWSPAVLGCTAIALGLVAIVTIPYGRRSGFLTQPIALQVGLDRPVRWFGTLIRLLIFPALIEEVIFRVALVPHPTEGVPPLTWLAWAALSLGLFVLQHVVLSGLRGNAAKSLRDRRFLVMVTWLGIVLTALYGVTGSGLAVVIVHWLVVVGWLLFPTHNLTPRVST